MELVCNTCGGAFNAKRSDARYCSPKCRTSAHRAAHNVTTRPRKRRALTESARDLGWDMEKIVRRIERVREDDRFTRNADTIALLTSSHVRRLREALDEFESALPADHGFRPDEVSALSRTGTIR